MNYQLTIDLDDLRIISLALGAGPYNQVAKTIAKIQAQVTEQDLVVARGQPDGPTAVDQ